MVPPVFREGGINGRAANAQSAPAGGHPGPQLPAARDPGRGRSPGRLPGPEPAGLAYRRRRHRLLRGALHGRDGRPAGPGQGSPPARSPGGVPPGGHRDRCRRPGPAGHASPGGGGGLHQHFRRGEGRERRLCHFGQRSPGGLRPARRGSHLRSRRQPRPVPRQPHHQAPDHLGWHLPRP